MFLGPIFSVEMVTMARRTRYFVLRGLYGVAMLVALVMVYVNSPAARSDATDLSVAANLTANFFTTFSFVQLVAVLLIGPAMVAGTIATERERRTIEYLFASHLSGVEIVLSKLAARILQIAALLLAGLPILALAMLLGGIAPEAILVVYAITASTVVTVASLSIAVSVLCARAREAVSTAYLVLLALLVVPTVIYEAGRANATFYAVCIEPINSQLLAANPLWILGMARLQASSAAPDAAWQMVFVLVRNQLIVAAAAVLWASLAIRRVHLRQARKVEKRRRHFQLFRPAIGDRPLLWKELFAARTTSRLGVIGRIAVMLLLACAVGPAVYGFVAALGNAQEWEIRSYLSLLVALSMAISCGMLLLLAARAAGSIASEKERDTWDSLLSSPLDASEIINAKIQGNLYAVRGGLWVLVLLWGLGAVFKPAFLIGGVFSLAVLMVLALFVTTVGVSFSISARNSIWAMGCTLGTCLFVGVGYLFCCMPLMIGSPSSGTEIVLAPCMPFLLAFPGMCVVEDIPSHESGIIGAFVVGVIGYAVATGFLYVATTASFDRRAGRVGVAWAPAGPLPVSPFLAEIVADAPKENSEASTLGGTP